MNKYNKIIISLVFLTTIAVSCRKASPDTLEGKKAILKKKKEQVKKLNEEIAVLREEILRLDPPKEKPPVVVESTTLERSPFSRYVTVQGLVVPQKKAIVSSETGGRILSLLAREGQYVKEGDLLAKVDMSTLQKRIDEVSTSLDLAKDIYRRQKELWDQKIGTEVQYIQAKNAVERLEKTISTLRSQLSKANVYAPMSGVIDHKFLEQGELAGPGMPIYNILNTSALKVEADIPENYLSKIKKGSPVNLYIPALNMEINKKVTIIGRSIDPANRTFKIEVPISNRGGDVKPNLLTQVKFRDFYKEEAIVIPLNLVQQEVSGKKYVFVIKRKDGRTYAQKRYIETGESYKSDILVTTGLSPGDELIIKGATSLVDGDPVKTL